MSTIFVATTGSDSAAGTEVAPVKTIMKGMSIAKSGDTVLVAGGTYTEGLKPNMVEVKAGVTLKSANRLGARLRPPSYVYAIVNLGSGATIDGFDIGSDRIHNHGVFCNGGRKIKALNNRCFGGAESGVGMMKVDFATIEGNECFENAWQTWGSGISIYEPESNGEATPEGEWRMIVRNNVSHHNVQEGGPYTDGNGIIIDDFQHWQNDPQVEFDFGCLVENNLSYQNGGKGIAVHWSNNCTVRRNTSIGNCLDNKNTTPWRGELSQQDCSGVRWEGNLAVPNPGANPANTGIGYYGGNSSTQWIGNATTDAAPNLGGSGALPGSGNLFNVDPALVDFVPTNPALANIGWRPSGVTPTPVPDPVPVPEPDPLPAAPADLSPFAAMVPGSIVTENQAYELGTKFRADKAGTITALRLYRCNTNIQPVRLWKAGVKIIEGSVPGGADGWQEVAVNVEAAAGDEFIVSVGKMAAQRYALDSNVLADPIEGDGFTLLSGIFSTSRGSLPTQVWQNSYYWIDVRFAEVAEPEPTDMEAALAALTARVAVLEGVPSDYGPRIIALTEKMATAEAGIAELNARLADLEGSASVEAIANIAAGVTDLAAALADLKDKLRAV